jgi:hypothetical protein
MRKKPRSYKKDIFPFAIGVISAVYSIYFYKFIPRFISRTFSFGFFMWNFSKKSDIFYIPAFIVLSCITFFILDRYYHHKSIVNKFYYFWEFYAASNFFLLTMLSYQYGATMHLAKANADLYTYFSPLGSTSFFVAVILIFRVILRSGSRLLYDEEAETNE